MKRILVAFDGSEGARRAVAFAAELAHGSESELTILTVIDGTADEQLNRYGRIERATISELQENEARALVARARSDVEKQGASNVKVKTEMGDAAEVILDTAKTSQSDLIVVGKRGRGQLQGLLLGSVSQKLVSLAQCPIAVIP
jgi:nucleotide-binding universal stress UspA family protein